MELAEQLVELAELFAELLPEVLADVAADVAGGTELEARVEIRQPEELEVLLMAVRCWDSLKS